MKPMEPMEPMKPMEPMRPMAPQAPWWPEGLGQPDSSGGQDDLQYAYFAGPRRLAVRRGGGVTLYDTGDRRISGVSQRQGEDGGRAAFRTDRGDVQLGDLRVVGG